MWRTAHTAAAISRRLRSPCPALDVVVARTFLPLTISVGVEFTSNFCSASSRLCSTAFSIPLSARQASACSGGSPPRRASCLSAAIGSLAPAQVAWLAKMASRKVNSARRRRSAPAPPPAARSGPAGSRGRPAWPCRCRCSAASTAGACPWRTRAVRARQRGVFDDRDRRVGLAQDMLVDLGGSAALAPAPSANSSGAINSARRARGGTVVIGVDPLRWATGQSDGVAIGAGPPPNKSRARHRREPRISRPSASSAWPKGSSASGPRSRTAPAPPRHRACVPRPRPGAAFAVAAATARSGSAGSPRSRRRC